MESNSKSGSLVKAKQPFIYKILPPLKPEREFLTEPYQIESNTNFKIYHFKPIPTTVINDLDLAMAALSFDLISTITTLCLLLAWH